MSIVSYEDYVDSPNVELLQRENTTQGKKAIADHTYYETVFEQYELDVPCYDNDTSLPELVSASVRPIYEFYQIPGVTGEHMRRGFNEESGEHPKRFANSRTPRWQEPEAAYDTGPDQSEEYVHTVYVDGGISDHGQNGFSQNCVFEEHYVFDVFEKPEDSSRAATAEYQSDSDWTGPIITEVTDSEDEQGSGEDRDNGDGGVETPKDPSVLSAKTRPPQKSVKCVSAVNNVGAPRDLNARVPFASNSGTSEEAKPSQSVGVVVEKLTKDVAGRPTGLGTSKMTGFKAATANIFNQELVADEEEFMWRQRQQKVNDLPSQMLLKAVGRKPAAHTVAPHTICNIPIRESVLLTGAFDEVGRISTPGPMTFTLNDSFDKYHFSLLNSLPDANMYPAHEYNGAVSFPYSQRQMLMASPIAMDDPYGDGILTAINHHNKLIDQFPVGVSAQYFHHRGAGYQPQEYGNLKLYQDVPSVRQFVSPSAVTANVERARKLREQQNRLQGPRRAGLIPTQLRHVGMQSQQPYMTTPQSEFLLKRRDFYRAPNDKLLDEVYQERQPPHARMPFDRVNVTVSARPQGGRFVDETTEVLEKLNDIYQYVLTKPTVGQVKTKIEEVHQSVHSRDIDDFFSLSAMTDFVDYNVKGGRLRPIHLKPQRKQVSQTVGSSFSADGPRTTVTHNVRLMNDRADRTRETLFASRPLRRPLNMRDRGIPNVELRNVNMECENCFEF